MNSQKIKFLIIVPFKISPEKIKGAYGKQPPINEQDSADFEATAVEIRNQLFLAGCEAGVAKVIVASLNLERGKLYRDLVAKQTGAIILFQLKTYEESPSGVYRCLKDQRQELFDHYDVVIDFLDFYRSFELASQVSERLGLDAEIPKAEEKKFYFFSIKEPSFQYLPETDSDAVAKAGEEE